MKLPPSAIALFLALPLLAQDQPKEKQDKPIPDPTAPPAALASPDATAPPTDLPLVAQAPEADPGLARSEPDYGGPAILSRGGVSSLRVPTENIRIRPFATINGNYDSGITPVTLNTHGNIPNDRSFGVDVQAGLYGYHRWRSATLGIDYKGSYRDYSNNTYYNGTDQTLSLIFQKQATRRIGITLRESAGLFGRNFYNVGPYNLVDPGFANTPTNDVFDGRTLYLNTMADLTYRMTPRLSVNFGGDGFMVRRTSSSLYGDTGYRARSDLSYRTSRYATSGVAYYYTHFEFSKAFGGSDMHTIALVQSYRLGRFWELSLQAGGSRIETLGVTLVDIDPVIAAIIGRNQGISVIYRINWAPIVRATLTRGFRRGSLGFNYDRSITPGNGVYLTSRSESAMASYSYSGIRRWNLGASAGYSTYASLTQTIGNYGGFSGGGGGTYKINRSLHFVCRADYRRYSIDQTVFQRDSYRLSIGLGFSPKDVPLSLW